MICPSKRSVSVELFFKHLKTEKNFKGSFKKTFKICTPVGRVLSQNSKFKSLSDQNSLRDITGWFEHGVMFSGKRSKTFVFASF